MSTENTKTIKLPELNDDSSLQDVDDAHQYYCNHFEYLYPSSCGRYLYAMIQMLRETFIYNINYSDFERFFEMHKNGDSYANEENPLDDVIDERDYVAALLFEARYLIELNKHIFNLNSFLSDDAQLFVHNIDDTVSTTLAHYENGDKIREIKDNFEVFINAVRKYFVSADYSVRFRKIDEQFNNEQQNFSEYNSYIENGIARDLLRCFIQDGALNTFNDTFNEFLLNLFPYSSQQSTTNNQQRKNLLMLVSRGV